ncbi:hypothetical protein Tco_0408719 [Tanacetum coccineum]
MFNENIEEVKRTNKEVYDWLKLIPTQHWARSHFFGSSKVAAVEELLVERDGLMRRLKQNLVEARNRMKVKANRNWRDMKFNVGVKIVERIGKVAYRLALPSTSKIHVVFHVSILKLFSGNGEEAVTELPEEFQEGQPLEKPMAICDSRLVLRNGSLVQQVIFKEGENVTPTVDGLGRGKRTKKAPGWQKEFVMG